MLLYKFHLFIKMCTGISFAGLYTSLFQPRICSATLSGPLLVLWLIASMQPEIKHWVKNDLWKRKKKPVRICIYINTEILSWREKKTKEKYTLYTKTPSTKFTNKWRWSLRWTQAVTNTEVCITTNKVRKCQAEWTFPSKFQTSNHKA